MIARSAFEEVLTGEELPAASFWTPTGVALWLLKVKFPSVDY
jgi:hypothetical protein